MLLAQTHPDKDDELSSSQINQPDSPTQVELASTSEQTTPVLVITGMHRSGTSLVASLLQQAGVDIGSDLVEPNEGNPRGYFEDRRFLGFHEELLRHSPHRVLVQDRSDLKLPDEEDARRARLLLERPRGRAWGWKDPRTSLFLDFWVDVLPPSARFVFVYRHPIDVLLSLGRRGFSSEVEAAADPLVGLRSWEVYNRSILAFYRRNAERCFLCNVYDVAADPAGFLEAVGQRLGMTLAAGKAGEVVHRSELSRSYSHHEVDSILRELAPEALAICTELTAMSDLPSVAVRSSNDHKGRDRNGWLEPAARLLAGSAGKRPPAGPFLAMVQAMLDPRTKTFHGENLRAQLSGLEDQIRELRAHAENLEARHQEDQVNIADITNHAQNLEKLLARREDDLTSQEQRVADLSSTLAKFRGHAENLEGLHRQDHEQIEELGRHAENLEELRRQDQEQLKELGCHARNLEQLHRRDHEQIGELEAHASNLETELQARNEHLADLVNHGRNLEEARDRQADHIGQLQARILDLERQVADPGDR